MKFDGCSTGIPGDGSPSGCLRVEVETSPATRREAAEAAGHWEISGILRISVKCFFCYRILSNVLDGEGDVFAAIKTAETFGAMLAGRSTCSI